MARRAHDGKPSGKIGRKRSKRQIELDYVKEAEWYRQGMLLSEIASRLGVTAAQVTYDLRIIRDKWLETAIDDFNVIKSNELSTIDKVELKAWESFERSLNDALHVINTTGEHPSSTVKRINQYGDPRFLTIVLDCSDRRCKLFGLYSPTVDLNFTADDLMQCTDEQLQRIANGDFASVIKELRKS
jgi:hypothetical protein